MNNYIPIYTLFGVGILYWVCKQTIKPIIKPVDTSNWTIKDWRLQVLLSVLILENPNILKTVNKESEAFKYFIEIRKYLNDNDKRQVLLEELANNNLLLKS